MTIARLVLACIVFVVSFVALLYGLPRAYKFIFGVEP